MLQKNTFLDWNFERIFYVLASENEGKIEQFAYFYRKHKFFRNFAIFWWFLDSKIHPKCEEKPFKFDASKQHVFGFEFWTDFLRFGFWKRKKNRAICVFLLKTQILQKLLFSPGKIIIFPVRSLVKSTKIGCSNAMKNNIEEKASKIEFGKPFGLPKSLKMGPQSNVKRSLFCHAMDLTRTSSEVNGGHSL